ncbi:MAG: icmT [Francisellaceae bacterium]|nr:icmT [Francisellaceae bacterium]
MPIREDTHWRDASRQPRFIFLDALSILPLIIWVLHARWWTFKLALAIIAFFGILERFKFTVPIFFRWFRSFLAGPYRSARPWFRD